VWLEAIDKQSARAKNQLATSIKSFCFNRILPENCLELRQRICTGIGSLIIAVTTLIIQFRTSITSDVPINSDLSGKKSRSSFNFKILIRHHISVIYEKRGSH
jgi:hypothetical protein